MKDFTEKEKYIYIGSQHTVFNWERKTNDIKE